VPRLAAGLYSLYSNVYYYILAFVLFLVIFLVFHLLSGKRMRMFTSMAKLFRICHIIVKKLFKILQVDGILTMEKFLGNFLSKYALVKEGVQSTWIIL